ncbi:hypothetical protein [Qipengyuania spongiae]|uniref:Aspartate-semialdehyde dehydrogenase n=1 Tax=Qipengyuania spongiae TaxID=2909673 RepID=A0ABY5SXU7_9SPHN|nr:hypothetical protein [Qipengyuania spongiae]UVI38681.1 hypothetical protein L1F33_10530 [Qipengyuania spongiae]
MPEKGLISLRSAAELIAAIALAGCSAAPEPSGESEPKAADVRADPVDRAATAQHEEIGTRARLALLSDGFAYRVAGGTSSEEVGFGIRRETVERIARQQFGEPSERSANAECGADPMSFSRYGSLTFNFQDGRLTGWFLDSGSELATADGVQPGTTSFTDIERERGAAMVEGSSLDREFRYASSDGGDIGGFLDADGTVASLYAGAQCFFR